MIKRAHRSCRNLGLRCPHAGNAFVGVCLVVLLRDDLTSGWSFSVLCLCKSHGEVVLDKSHPRHNNLNRLVNAPWTP